MKKILIIFGLAVIALGFGAYFASSYLINPNAVSIKEDGFSKDLMVVEQGSTITWKNAGKADHWPASNDHPTHGKYPGEKGCIGSNFDACKGLKPGETYSFKFDQIGEWGVHDHLFPGLVMAIRVVAKGESTEIEDISNSVYTSSAFKNLGYAKQVAYIKNMADKDPSKAWDYLKEAFIVDGKVIGNAHEFSHIIGNTAYLKMGFAGIKICDSAFAFGCFHGVTEKMLLEQGTKNLKNIQNECLRLFPPNESQDYSSCIHGTGHGIYGYEGGDMTKSLTDCDILDPNYRQFCYDGVFMENSGNEGGVSFDTTDPWKFCEVLDEKYQRNCARYQVPVFLNSGPYDDRFKTAGKYCSLTSNTLLRETCYENLGYSIANATLGKAPEIIRICTASVSTKDICIAGGAIESVFQKYGTKEYSLNELCAKISEPTKSYCITRIKQL